MIASVCAASPLPLAGRGWGRGSRNPDDDREAPHPNPPPQGGGNAPPSASAKASVEPLAEPARKVLDELPGDAARTRAARRRPFQRLGAEPLGRDVEAVAPRIARDHREI